MSAAYSLPEHHHGVISVVPETAKIVALCLEGEFDVTNASALDTQIHFALDHGYNLILDFSETTFIDSSVIHVLVRAAQSARTRKQTIVLQLGTATIVERVFEITNIEQMVPRAHDRHKALRTIQQEANSDRVARESRDIQARADGSNGSNPLVASSLAPVREA